MSNYSSQLRDRRWQKRRLEILERDGFKCAYCGSVDNHVQLHVHHRAYLPKTALWDYPEEYLTTLCAECHARATEQARLNSITWAEITATFCDESSIRDLLLLLIEIRDKRPDWDIEKSRLGGLEYPPEAAQRSIDDIQELQGYLQGIV